MIWMVRGVVPRSPGLIHHRRIGEGGLLDPGGYHVDLGNWADRDICSSRRSQFIL